jgi:hypothetical protein
MTREYKRHGTTDLFAALNIGAGEVLIDTNVDPDLAIHLVLDNLSAHRGPDVTKWPAHPRRARWHLRFTPTSSSWTNLVEGWFKELWNLEPKAYVWYKPADEIIAQVRHGWATPTQIKFATEI